MEIRDAKEADSLNNNSFFVRNSITKKHKGREKNRLIQVLESLNLAGVNMPDRFIPDVYKYSDLKTREQLLVAIIDCSAYANGSGFQFTLSSKRLANDLIFLARSIGLAATCKEAIKSGKKYQTVSLSGDTTKLPLKNKKGSKGRNASSKTFSIEPIGQDDFVQIKTSGNYLTEDFTILR